MDRIQEEKAYWDKMASHRNVASKIADKETPAKDCVDAIYPAIKNTKGSIIEIGCGIGRLTIPMAKKMKKRIIEGVDISDRMVKIANEKAKKQKIKNAWFTKNDGRHIGSKNSFKTGAVYSMTTFQHITAEGVKGYINQAGELLNKGGIFRFQFVEGEEKSAFSQQYQLEEIKMWCKEAGLTVTNIDRGLIYEIWTWITAKKN